MRPVSTKTSNIKKPFNISPTEFKQFNKYFYIKKASKHIRAKKFYCNISVQNPQTRPIVPNKLLDSQNYPKHQKKHKLKSFDFLSFLHFLQENSLFFIQIFSIFLVNSHKTFKSNPLILYQNKYFIIFFKNKNFSETLQKSLNHETKADKTIKT